MAQDPDYYTAFASRSPEQRKALLARMSPEGKAALSKEIQAHQKPAGTDDAPEQPNSVLGGAVRRTYDLAKGAAHLQNGERGDPVRRRGSEAGGRRVPGSAATHTRSSSAIPSVRQGGNDGVGGH
jgi:hypothetical protein